MLKRKKCAHFDYDKIHQLFELPDPYFDSLAPAIVIMMMRVAEAAFHIVTEYEVTHQTFLHEVLTR